MQWQHLFLGRRQSEVVVSENTFDARPRTLQHVMAVTFLQLTVLTCRTVIVSISIYLLEVHLLQTGVVLLIISTNLLQIKPGYYPRRQRLSPR